MQLKPSQLDLSSLPQSILPYLHNADIYNSSCSDRAQTFCIKGSQTMFLKIDKAALLQREQALITWLAPFNLAPQLISYQAIGETGYLLTTALSGSDGISEEYLQQPQRLAVLMGQSLARLHSLPVQNCPYPNRNNELLLEAQSNISQGIIDRDICSLPFPIAAQRFMQLRSLPLRESFIHGDFCLPNIIIEEWQVTGFVDFGTGGIADPHYDLFWGVWTLNYNLKTPVYGDAFLRAYGIEKVNKDKLELCHLIAAFTF